MRSVYPQGDTLRRIGRFRGMAGRSCRAWHLSRRKHLEIENMGKRVEEALPTGGRYIDGDERAEYVDRPLKLLSVKHEPTAQFGPRFVIDAAVMDTGERVAIALSENPTRVTMFTEIGADLARDGADAYEPVCLVLAKGSAGGNDYWTFRSATEAEITEAASAGALATEADETTDDESAEPVKTAKAGK